MYSKSRRVFLLILLFSGFCSADTLTFSSKAFLDEIRNSQELYYNKTVQFYDSLLAGKADAAIMLEKCRFMETALYDPETEENPKYDDWENCYDQLLNTYPDDLDANLYRLEHQYGDSAVASAKNLITRFKKSLHPQDAKIAKVYEKMAYAYSYLDSFSQSAAACKSAMLFDDTINVNLLLARQYIALGLREKAYKTIMEGEHKYENWEKQDAAGLLLQLRYPEEALDFYLPLLEDTSAYIDYSELATAYEQVGEFDSARIFFQKSLEYEYDELSAAKTMFEFDLRHSKSELALESYRALRDNGFFADPFSFYRYRLFLKNPFLMPQWREFLGILSFLLACIIMLLIPYLWILPLHYWGSKLINKNSDSIFSLRHLWIICSGMMIVSFIATGLFQHETFSMFFKEIRSSSTSSDINNSYFLITFCSLNMLLALLVLIKSKSWTVFTPRVPLFTTIAFLIAGYVLLIMVRKANISLFPELAKESAKSISVGSVIVLTKSLIITKGILPALLVSCVIVPIYEEYLFRGVSLEALRKYFPFWFANAIQAAAFAVLHDSIQLFPSFFFMGLLFGWLYRRTRSLFISILLHSINNIFAISTIYVLMQRNGF